MRFLHEPGGKDKIWGFEIKDLMLKSQTATSPVRRDQGQDTDLAEPVPCSVKADSTNIITEGY